MKYIFSLCLCLNVIWGYSQDYQKLHSKSVVIDTHNDILDEAMGKGYRFEDQLKGKTHSDLDRMLKGGLDAQVFSVWCDGSKQTPYSWANQQIDTLYAWISRSPSKMVLVKTPKELSLAVKHRKLAAMIGVEGGHMIENSLGKLDTLFQRGAKYMTLTWNNSTGWATSAMEESEGMLGKRPKGLTDFGKEVVRRMNELGMMVDVSHVGEQTFWDVISTTTKPVIASHSCTYSICPVFRNLKDEQIKAIAKNGGVIHLNFYSAFVDSAFTTRSREFRRRHQAERDSLQRSGIERSKVEAMLLAKYPLEEVRPPLSLLIDHLDRIVKLAGIDHVGLGSDFDGISSTPQQLDDVTDYPNITNELLHRGYSRRDIGKVLGGNFVRVFKENMK